jgi:peptide-methionine (R)-S-oxide reductase
MDTNAKQKRLAELSPEEIEVTQHKGTEAPFVGKYWKHNEKGMYVCKVCGTPLFSSDAKFDSKSGWPSFDAPVFKDAVELHRDDSHGMIRTEVTCKNCGAHLGHVFPDGPEDTTGERYCINSCSLDFDEK